jgi:integrase-like protein
MRFSLIILAAVSPVLLLGTREATPLDRHNVGRAFARLLEEAKLPSHFSPHCLRHTFASLLLQRGKSPAYVQRQLGHANITLTVDTYGRWLPMSDKSAVDELDGQDGSKTVAKRARPAPPYPQPREFFGEPSGTRTRDPLIKSQVLFLLS